ncbi:hypothetical protein AB205_0178740 [Aquarana catesbeiana]|uniref:Uncharacterized protein n=1 Tax=Aquarana catesbeiana TaxID=8400 RepID=A0A2G9S3V3_AQUCT|nr:hypothetical protein AB205_0178740 [Aquarana catesbeiana]PIO34142.1 hypothetical protein AB205_0178740 [Aquarana catesbeiana]PIO34143.1 hypothetical protein AB205_0178740 [Aquarana catesbeiana]
MEMEIRSALPEISLRTLFSRSSRRLLRSLNWAVTLSVSPAASSSTFLLCSCRLWTLSSVSSLFVRRFCRTFLSVSFFFPRSVFQHLHLVSSMFSSQTAGHTDASLILGAVILQDLLMDGAFPALHGQGGVT